MSSLAAIDARELIDLAPLIRRAVGLDPASVVRIRTQPGAAHALVRLPFGVLVGRRIPGRFSTAHDGTYSTGYGHIAAGQILVHSGEQIHAGQLIARTGATGTATGCHLHYMVISNGTPVNPVPFMRGQGIVLGQV
mgnify:CR=1 FL=1